MNSLSKKIILICGLGILLLIAYTYIGKNIPSNTDGCAFKLFAHAYAAEIITSGEQSHPLCPHGHHGR